MRQAVATALLLGLLIVAVAAGDVERIKELVQLKNEGHLTEEEYRQFVNRLLVEPPASTLLPYHESRAASSTPPRRETRALTQQSDALDGASAWFKADNARLVFGGAADCALQRQHPGDLVVPDCPLHAGAGLKVGANSGASCSTAAHGGFVRYNANDQKLELCDGAAWGAVGGDAEPGQLAATPVPYWTNLRFSHPNENTRFTMMDNSGQRVIADHGNNGHTVQAATVDGVFRGAFAIAFECSYSWGWAGIKPVQIF